MAKEHGTPGYLERVNFSSPEEILQRTLGEKYGERYHAYRRAYYHSLEADRHGSAPDFAHTVTIEFVNRCNLSCSMCYVANHTFPKATLSLDEVRAIIDEVAGKEQTGLLLGVGSEGLLYKNIRKVIEYAKSRDVMDIILMTNGTLLSEDLAEFLIKLEVSRVCISVDAATRETYEKVRGKDELDKLERNIRGLVAAKRRLGSALPVVRLSFCAVPENQHEQVAFREKWEDVVDYIDYQKVADFSHVGSEEEVELGESAGERLFCSKPFGYLNVWSNGDISPCCTFYGKNLVFGNIRENTLQEVYDGPKMQELREQFRTGRNLNKICQVCLATRENLVDEAITR